MERLFNFMYWHYFINIDFNLKNTATQPNLKERNMLENEFMKLTDYEQNKILLNYVSYIDKIIKESNKNTILLEVIIPFRDYVSKIER